MTAGGPGALLLAAAPAWAAPTPAPTAPAAVPPGVAQGAPLLAPFDLADSSGVHVSQYELNIDHGGFTHPWKMILAFPLLLLWEIYHWVVGITAWLIDWLLQFAWVSILVDVATPIAASVHNVLFQAGVMPVALTLAGFIGGWWLVRGGVTRGITEVLTSGFIAALAIGALSSPITVITGPNGMLGKAQSGGLEISAALASGVPGTTHPVPGASGAHTGSAPPSNAEVRRMITGAIVTNYIRRPQQLINYGAVIDNDPVCVATYNEVLSQGPWGTEDDTPRQRLGHCNESYGKYAGNPNFGQYISLLMLMPSALLLVVFGGIFAFGLVSAVLFLLYESIKLTWHLVVGIVPGASRGGLWSSLANVGVGLLLVAVTTVTLGAYMMGVNAAFAGTTTWAIGARFLFLDMLTLVGSVILITQRKRLKASAGSWAQRMASASRVGGGGSTRLPQASGGLTMGKALGGAAVLRRAMPAVAAGAVAGEVAGHTANRAAASTLRQRIASSKVGTLGKLAGKTAFVAAASTVGAPVYLPRALKTAGTAAKAARGTGAAALRAKLSTARAFGNEYVGNVAAAGRGVARVAEVAATITGADTATRAVAVGAQVAAWTAQEAAPAVIAAGAVRLNALRRETRSDGAATAPTAPRTPGPQVAGGQPGPATAKPTSARRRPSPTGTAPDVVMPARAVAPAKRTAKRAGAKAPASAAAKLAASKATNGADPKTVAASKPAVTPAVEPPARASETTHKNAQVTDAAQQDAARRAARADLQARLGSPSQGGALRPRAPRRAG